MTNQIEIRHKASKMHMKIFDFLMVLVKLELIDKDIYLEIWRNCNSPWLAHYVNLIEFHKPHQHKQSPP